MSAIAPRVQGHRGAVYIEPENTVASFLAAKSGGAVAVELDVFLLTDGSLVCYHGGGADGRAGGVEELTDGHGLIQDMSLADVQALNFVPTDFACPPLKIFTRGEYAAPVRIPTLEEALDACIKVNLRVTIELKGEGTASPVVALLQKMHCDFVDAKKLYSIFGMISCSSFDVPRVTLAASLDERLSTDVLFTKPIPEDFVKIVTDAGAKQVDFRYDTITPAISAAARAAKLRVMVWFRGPNTMEELGVWDSEFFDGIVACDIDVMCTNQPNVFAEYLKEKEKEKKEITSKKRQKVAPNDTDADRSPRRRVRFDTAKPTVRVLTRAVDRSPSLAQIFHCDECERQFAAGLRGFEKYWSCDVCGPADDGYDLCEECYKKDRGVKHSHESGHKSFMQIDRNKG